MVLTPFGVSLDDLVELVSKNKCPECRYEVDTFTVHGRIMEKEGLGCSSIVKWI
ncbi:MAG: hypothetical protein ACFE8M_12525 [Candidatus Hermodarchaeota archaeon]